MKYEKTVSIPAEKYDKVNELLELDNLDEMTEGELNDIGAEIEHVEKIYEVEFEDKSKVMFFLRSGLHNYFDEVVWFQTDEEPYAFDPEFSIGDFSFCFDGDCYCVKVERYA